MKNDWEFNFNCDVCNKDIVKGAKFSLESVEWESSVEGGSGGIDLDKICSKCHEEIDNYIEKIRKN